jgi:hypothetical protein
MATLPINNPQRILQTLDSYLEKETRIVLFGRAALALGFGNLGTQFGKTLDVDAILPSVEMSKIESDIQFWNAIELTNKSLAPTGLYISHLFTDRQVALTSSWLSKIVAIPSGSYKFLQLFRPSSLDLILTKMMRNDREDLEDIRFILGHDKIGQSQLDLAFSSTGTLEVQELQKIFEQMQPVVRTLAVQMELTREKEIGTGPTQNTRDPDWWSKFVEPPALDREKDKDKEIEL